MRTRFILAAAVLIATAACSDSPSGECSDPNGCVDSGCAGSECDDSGTDLPAPGDIAGADVSEDPAEDEGGDAIDAAGDTECDGDFLCPCEGNNDCEFSFCIEYDGGRVCTVPCIDSCPEPEWECRLLENTGGDLVSICVPPNDSLCIACDNDLDCGGLSDLCLELGDGEFCGANCEETGCPDGYLCEPFSRNGEEFLQCSPEFSVCSSCVDTDNDGYGLGAGCLGTDCDDLQVSVFADAPELCDGLDNDCDDAEDEDFDLLTSLQHCGECGAVCAPGSAAEFECAEGVCTIGECDAGYADCNLEVSDGCEIFTDESLEHCGACDAECAFDGGIAICEAGVCSLDACRPNFGDCDEDAELNGCETNLLDSLSHCGACDNSCEFRDAVGACSEGGCEFVECLDGFANCNETLDDGCEVELAVDALHCGACFDTCDLANTELHACADSICEVISCDGGFADCDPSGANGCEVDLTSDATNCGACGFVCELDSSVASCVASECAVEDCLDDWFDCNENPEDGCETDLATDELHCGFCDFACDTTHVSSGECSARECTILDCDFGWGNCSGGASDGCEQELLSDISHCGECGTECDEPNAISVCETGACEVSECAFGWSDLNGDLSDGCDYECTFILEDDQPDNGFLDADCDGVDGNIEESIFVSSTGDDRNSGRTPGEAVESLNVGLLIAGSERRTHVLVSADAYTGGELSLPDGVSLYGGYSTDFRNRDGTLTQYAATTPTAIRIADITTPVNIDRMRFTTPNQGSGGWTATVVVENSGSNVFISYSEILPGDGGDGAAGSGGESGADGGNGGNGSGDNGGDGGSTPSGSPGGGGGDGVIHRAGNAGAAGAANEASYGGSAGASSGSEGLGCLDGDPELGGDGGDAANGGAGANGAAGNGVGSILGVTWNQSSGDSGAPGQTGGSGGGGGAGGGEECERICAFGACICEPYCGTGRGGGGGGGGGERGSGGNGGNGGGATVGVIINSATLRLNNTTITGGNGGNGGEGGAAGPGGDGGSGGDPAVNSSSSDGNGGPGGDGGDGGNGGCGGGGGGGPSIGLWLSRGGGIIEGAGTSISGGSGGSGGSSCGTSGTAGASAARRDDS